MAAIEPARYTVQLWKRWNSRTSLRRLEFLPLQWGWAVESHGVEPSSRWRLRALRRLRRNTAAPRGWERPSRRCGAARRRGRRRGCCGQRRPGSPETAGGGVEGWSDAEWVKEQLGDKLLDDFECAMYTELWQDWRQLGGIRIFWIFSYAMVRYFDKWQYMRWQSDRTQWHPPACYQCSDITRIAHTQCRPLTKHSLHDDGKTSMWNTTRHHKSWDILRDKNSCTFATCMGVLWVWKRAWECSRDVEIKLNLLSIKRFSLFGFSVLEGSISW